MWGNNEGSNWNPNASYPPPPPVSGNVDWGALAQQWIAMKGQFDLPPVAVPPPPTLHLPSTSFPPPNLIAPPITQHSHHLGEANMDLDEEEEPEEEILKPQEPLPKPMSRHRKPREPLSQKSLPTIDANARKKLPPWIREGLEKMEREKQKKEQMEKRQREKEEVMRRIREEEEELEDTKVDEEDHVVDEEKEGEELDDPSPSNGKGSKTKEELLEEMTTTLRHTLTEILLEVTSSEIQNVCVEILDKYRRRQVAVKENHQKALGQLLSGYASDEDRISSEGSSVEDDSRSGGCSYSDEENLESLIRKKKREFEKTSEKINSICAAKEESFSLREKRWIDEGELKEGMNLAHIYRKEISSNSYKDNSEEREIQSPVRSASSSSKIQVKRNRSKERKSRESRRSISSDSYEKRSRSKERSYRERRPRSRERYEKRSPSRERRISRNKSSSKCDKRSVSRERNALQIEGSRKHKSKKYSRDEKSHRRHSRDEKRKRRKRHSSSFSSSPSPVRSSKKSRHRKRSRS